MTSTAVGTESSRLFPVNRRAEGRAPKLHRVHDRATHARLRRARRVRRGPLTISCVLEDGSRAPRVAYAIGRNAGGAVQRNRARRRLRAVKSELSSDLLGRAWLVGAGADVLEADAAELSSNARSAVKALAAR